MSPIFQASRSNCYFDVGGYDAHYSCAGDYDLCLRLSELSEPVLIEKVLYLYRVHSSSSSQVSQSITHRESVLAARSALKRRGFHHSCLLDSPAHESVVRIDEFNGPIFIAGLHRSGTSLLCRILSSFGFSFPGPLLDSDDDNPTGYYENTDQLLCIANGFLVCLMMLGGIGFVSISPIEFTGLL